jgi:hypothetical protein
MSRTSFASLSLVLCLAACAQTPARDVAEPTESTDEATAAHCDASQVADAIGQLPMPETQQWARGKAGAEVVRVLQHNQPVTKEFRAGRLNLVLDSEGKIASANCS